MRKPRMENIYERSLYYLHLPIQAFTREDVDALKNILEYHSYLYFEKNSPIISDYEYDMLVKKFEALQKEFNIHENFLERVGYGETSFLSKVKHSRPMISLENTYNDNDLLQFEKRIQKYVPGKEPITYTIEYKFDGVGIELIYENGKLIQAITRGNGYEGEDVTINVSQIENIPKTIPYTKKIEVRGEIVMSLREFEKINTKLIQNNEKTFSHPRNAVSGTIRVKNPEIVKERGLQFFAYDIGNIFDISIMESIPTYSEIKTFLESLHFQTSDYFCICVGIEEVILAIQQFNKYVERNFEIDGLVIKVNEIALWKILGTTSHHPRYAIAYKFPEYTVTTQILSIDHQVGRTGTLTPVANVTPIVLGGVEVKRATLHNYEYVQHLGIHLYDHVLIKRAGEVIPKIIGVIEDLRTGKEVPILPPSYCPSCKSPIKKDENQKRYYCPNTRYCPKQIQERIIFSVSKEGFNIAGLGRKHIELFFKHGIIQEVYDIFELHTKVQEILALEGFGKKLLQNILTAIEKAKIQPLDAFIVALNIPGIGKNNASIFHDLITTPDDIGDFPYTIQDMMQYENIGTILATNIVNFFHDPYNKHIIHKLLEHITIQFPKNTQEKKKTFYFCITGTFEHFSRKELIALLEGHGGIFTPNIQKKTEVLFVGNNPGSKLEKAKSNHIFLVFEKDIEPFLARYKTFHE